MKIPFVEWAPDQPTLDSGATAYVQNVLPLTKQSYGAIKTLTAAGDALTGRCQGMATFRGAGGTVVNFSADATKIYSWNGTSHDDVSRTVGGAYAIASEDMADFAQFGSTVVYVNGTDAPQAFTIGTSTDFAALAGTPPVARFCEVVGDHMVLLRLSSAQNRLHFSAINDVTGWTVGTNLSDTQDLPIGGRIMGCVGGQYGIIFSESAIHRMDPTGTTAAFSFRAISPERGCAAEGSIASYNNMIFFLARDGFFMLAGEQLTPIGDQKVDDWFWQNVNQSYLYRVVATIDPVRKLYIVAFPSLNSANGTPDTVLFANWTIGRWTQASISLDYIAGARTSLGYNTDNIDTLLGNTDATDYSGDSILFTGSASPTLAAYGTDKKLSFFSGANMEATIDTVEGQIAEGQRAIVTRVRPLVDGGSPQIRIGYRNNLFDAVTWSSVANTNDAGIAPFRINARFHRGRLIIPAGSEWTHAQGLDFNAVPTGWR